MFPHRSAGACHRALELSGGHEKNVYVASNCEDVELFVTASRSVMVKILIAICSHLKTWRGKPAKSKRSPTKTAAANGAKQTYRRGAAACGSRDIGPKGFQADGSDVAFTGCGVVDANGERCPTFQQRVNFDISGVESGVRLQQRQNKFHQHQFLDSSAASPCRCAFH